MHRTIRRFSNRVPSRQIASWSLESHSSSRACVLCQHRFPPPISPTAPQLLSSRKAYSTPTNPEAPRSPQREAFAPQTHYDLFPQTLPDGPPPATPFQIDIPTLRREFLQLQSKTHPDKFPTGADKARAEGLSARINEAYKTLTSPLLRAQYLLSLRGIDVKNEAQGSQNQDPETLMHVLEIQERLEEGDLEESEVEQMKKDNERRIETSVDLLGELMKSEQWEDAGHECVRLQYWMNVKQGLENWEKGGGGGGGGMTLVH